MHKLYLSLLLTTSLFSTSLAQVFVDAGATGANDGSSWTNAYTDLTTAIIAASANDEVWVKAGTYFPGSSRTDAFPMKNDVAIYGGFAGGETQLSQRSWQTNVTLLSGDVGTPGDDSDNCYSVVECGSGINRSAILDGFHITGGNSNGGNSSNGEYRGGAVYAGATSPTIRYCEIYGNYANQGSAFGHRLGGYGKVEGCIIHDNSSGTFNGGAIYAGYAWNFSHGNAKIEILNCVFYNNAAWEGAAIYVINGPALITNNTITENTGVSAVQVGSNYTHGKSSEFYNNVVYNNSGAEVNITNLGSANNPIIVDDNLIEGGFATGTNIMDQNPGFVDAANDDFRLSICSPGLQQANGFYLTGVTQDALGNNRTEAIAPDYGAYELVYPTIDVTHESCAGANDGLIVVNDLSPTWVRLNAGAYQTIPLFTGLSPATYNIEFSDGQGNCAVDLGSAVIDGAQAIAVSIVEQTNPLKCANKNSLGSVLIAGSGGEGNFNYSNDGIDFVPSGEFAGLAIDSHMLYAQDQNGCIDSIEVVIPVPYHIAISPTVADVTCNGDFDGQIEVNAGNGLAPYQLSINGNDQGSGFPITVENLTAGTYMVSVSDANGCDDTMSVVVTEPDTIAITGVVQDDNGSNTGSVDVSVVGGTPGFTYLWDDSNETMVEDLSNVGAGSYQIIVQDINGCSNDVSFVVGTITNIAELMSAGMVSVYPNPTVDVVQVNGSLDVEELVVFNRLGNQVMRSSGINELNLESLPAGNYVLQINTSSDSHTVNILKN